tara:strand:+ start:605 stop:919 length:315 start_codon:yes stop_codon:yes gene_type:complete
MIKSTLRYVLLIVCIAFLINCDTESILENLTGIDMIWLCPDSNVVFDSTDMCNNVCSVQCIGYEADEIPLSWTYYCEETEEYYETIQDCQTDCPSNCKIETISE